MLTKRDQTVGKHCKLELLSQVFRDLQKEFHLEAFAVKTFLSEGKIETSFILFEVEGYAKLLTSLSIQEKSNQIFIQMVTYFCHPDLTPIRPQHYHFSFLLARALLKINSVLRIGYFALDRASLTISFKANSNSFISHGSTSQYQIFSLLRTQFIAAHKTISEYIYKILFLLNIFSRKDILYLPELLERANKTQPLLYTPITINPAILERLDSIKQDLLKCRQNPTVWSSREEKYLSKPIFKEEYQTPIVTKIRILKYEPADKIFLASGGFGSIYTTSIDYLIEGAKLSKKVVIKEPKLNVDVGERERSKNEMRVLDHFYFRKSTCPHIARFFKVDDDVKAHFTIGKEAIIMKYYPRVLSQMQNKKVSASLHTKLWLLLQIAYALQFLASEGVYHLDVKDSNILIQKNMSIRLTDFGESYVRDIDTRVGITQIDYNKIFKPGRTLPYAAPELEKSPFDAKSLNERSDIFSFGMMMGNYLFETMFVEYKRSNKKNLTLKYQNLTYKTKVTSENVVRFGPKQLMKLLRSLALQCIHPDPSQRPTYEWIVIILKKSIDYLNDLSEGCFQFC